ARGTGMGKTLRAALVGQHQADIGVDQALRRGVNQGTHIAAAPGNQDSELQSCHAAAMPSIIVLRISLFRDPTRPIRYTTSPALARASATVPASSGATTAIMPIPQLNVRANSTSGILPARASQRNTGVNGQERASSSATRSAGRTRGIFS